jgi:hypothetical protein
VIGKASQSSPTNRSDTLIARHACFSEVESAWPLKCLQSPPDLGKHCIDKTRRLLSMAYLFNSSSPNDATLQLLPDQPWEKVGPFQQKFRFRPPLKGPSIGRLPSLTWPTSSGATDGAILSGFPTTGYAGYRIRIEEDLKVHDSPIQGRISGDYAKTLTRA